MHKYMETLMTTIKVLLTNVGIKLASVGILSMSSLIPARLCRTRPSLFELLHFSLRWWHKEVFWGLILLWLFIQGLS